jgi:hypothetical protein
MMTLFAASSVASTAAPFLVRATMAAAPTVFVHCFGLLSGFCIFFFRLAIPLAPGHVGCARRVIAASSLVGTHCATVQRHAGCTWTCACTFVPAFCRAAVAARRLEDVDFRMACAHRGCLNCCVCGHRGIVRGPRHRTHEVFRVCGPRHCTHEVMSRALLVPLLLHHRYGAHEYIHHQGTVVL